MSKIELLEKIANLIVAETPMDQIAMVCGLSEQEVILLRDSDEGKKSVAIVMAERIEDEQNTNLGWDAVERDAIGIVLDNLKWNKDPRFALAAAAQANKAVRRGKNPNVPLDASNGVRAVINLQMNFVKHLEKSTQEARVIDETAFEQKMVDCMEPAKIESLLEAGLKKVTVDDEDELPGFDSLAIAAQ